MRTEEEARCQITFCWAWLIFSQTVVFAISLTVTYIYLGREVRYVAQIAERILNRVEDA